MCRDYVNRIMKKEQEDLTKFNYKNHPSLTRIYSILYIIIDFDIKD